MCGLPTGWITQWSDYPTLISWVMQTLGNQGTERQVTQHLFTQHAFTQYQMMCESAFNLKLNGPVLKIIFTAICYLKHTALV